MNDILINFLDLNKNKMLDFQEAFFCFVLFSCGFFFAICLTYIYKNFSTALKFNKFQKLLFPQKICHCGKTKNPPYCDKSHPFAYRCFRWWRWINENLDERDKGL
jgi:hypothetical protein